MREIGERYLRKIYYNLKTCALWLFMAGLTGVGVGAFSSAFSFCLKKVTMLRGEMCIRDRFPITHGILTLSLQRDGFHVLTGLCVLSFLMYTHYWLLQYFI